MCDSGLTKKCLVCGDKAIGNNFDALSCESCKAFFRRNAIKKKDFKCHFDNNCKIDVTTRRFCKRCRLRKCLDIGMKRDWILSDEEKKVRKTKIETNRDKKRSGDFSSNSDCSYSPDNTSDNREEFDDRVNSFELNLDVFSAKKQMSTIEDIVYKKAVELEFAVIPIARPITDYRNNFNELEGNKLTELLNATSIMQNTNPLAASQASSLWDVCRVMGLRCEQDIRDVIKMSKKLMAFNTIREDDKLVLMKHTSLGLSCLRSVAIFNCEQQYFTMTLNTGHSVVVSFETMRALPRNFYAIYNKFLGKISREWESDFVILDLLTAIALFNPDNPKLTAQELVRLQQHIYMHLLQRYLLLKYQSESESKLKFLRLLSVLVDLNVLENTYRLNCAEKEPELCPPLVKEIATN